ncbi:hypothetical protein EJB05_39247, partial [Eragrostis curvula]
MQRQNGSPGPVALAVRASSATTPMLVWGTSGDLGQTSIIRAAYENPAIRSRFLCRAWVRVIHPFNPKDFVQSVVQQFRSAAGIDAILCPEKTWQEMAMEFNGYVNEVFFIVINDLSTIEEWDQIEACFPNNKKGSRIVVSTVQIETARLCIGQESAVSVLKLLSSDQTIYAFHEKVFQVDPELMKTRYLSYAATRPTTSTNSYGMPTNEVLLDGSEDVYGNKVVRNSLDFIRSTAGALEKSHLIGREKEVHDIIQIILNQNSQQLQVISVYGMGGLGKTTLVKYVYQSQKLSFIFYKHACVTVMRPFHLEEVLQSLVAQLSEPCENECMIVRKAVSMMRVEALRKELDRLLEGRRCFIVLDDLSSTTEWDLIRQSFRRMDNASKVVITTREENVARHCSENQENICKLKVLEHKDALDLFTKKWRPFFISDKMNFLRVLDLEGTSGFSGKIRIVSRTGMMFALCFVASCSLSAWQDKGHLDIRRLTRLRKLAVTGINKKNSKEFRSALADLPCLESLSVQSEWNHDLSGCLDAVLLPPKNLQSLKLYGNLVKLPKWIKELKTLVKLNLAGNKLLEFENIVQVLGDLSNLAILKLYRCSLKDGVLCFSSHPEKFLSLAVLGLDHLDGINSVEFEGATPKLEVLCYGSMPIDTKINESYVKHSLYPDLFWLIVTENSLSCLIVWQNSLSCLL